MSYLIGSIAASQKIGRCKVRSVMVTAGAANAVVTIDPYGLSASSSSLLVNALANDTVQVNFAGIPFDSGIIVTPDSDTLKYVVEYDTDP